MSLIDRSAIDGCAHAAAASTAAGRSGPKQSALGERLLVEVVDVRPEVGAVGHLGGVAPFLIATDHAHDLAGAGRWVESGKPGAPARPGGVPAARETQLGRALRSRPVAAGDRIGAVVRINPRVLIAAWPPMKKPAWFWRTT